VVLSVLALFLAIVLPAVQYAREQARRTTCMNNLKQISLATHHYTQANRMFPPGTICSTAPTKPSDHSGGC